MIATQPAVSPAEMLDMIRMLSGALERAREQLMDRGAHQTTLENIRESICAANRLVAKAKGTK